MSCNGLLHDDSCECTREAAIGKLRKAENRIKEMEEELLALSTLGNTVLVHKERADKLESERDRYKAALERIENSRTGYDKCATSGEGHAECVAIAREALAVAGEK